MLSELEKARSGTQIYFPSFVATDGGRVLRHWKPIRTGIEAIDVNQGQNYCQEALRFCRRIGAPFFMVCVLKDIRYLELGSVEIAFLRELASKATAGGNSPGMIDQEAQSLSRLHKCDLELIRGVEWATRDFILNANQYRQPETLYAAILEWLGAPDTWIAEVTALAISSAAMKGLLN